MIVIMNCFSNAYSDIKFAFLKHDILPFIFEVLQDISILDLNIIEYLYSTLAKILDFSEKENFAMYTILLDTLKRDNLDSLIERQVNNKNQRISSLANLIIVRFKNIFS